MQQLVFVVFAPPSAALLSGPAAADFVAALLLALELAIPLLLLLLLLLLPVPLPSLLLLLLLLTLKGTALLTTGTASKDDL